MFCRISVCMFLLGLVYGATSTAHAIKAPSQTTTQSFAYSGKLPKIANTRLALSESSPKQTKKKLAVSQQPSQCGDKLCDVVIIDDGVGPGLRIMGLMLNIFLPFAIGSWVVGDRLGAYFGTSAQIVGFGLFLLGYLIEYGSSFVAGTALIAIGATLMLAGWILPMITVMLFRRSRYQRRYHRRDHYRRRYYRRRHYDRSQASNDNVYNSPLAKAFQPTASVKAMGFSF